MYPNVHRSTVCNSQDMEACPTSNAEEVKVELFYEDLQDLLELTHQKDVLFILRDWNAKVEVKRYPE